MIKIFDDNGDVSDELHELMDYGGKHFVSFLVIFFLWPLAVIGWLMKKIDKKQKQEKT